MRNCIALFLMLSVFSGCQKSSFEKPDRLIEKEVMVNIIYDLSIAEAIKSQNPASMGTTYIIPNDYIYKKYKIDSLQFAKSDQYYAKDIKVYKKIYESVSKRLAEEIKNYDSANVPKAK